MGVQGLWKVVSPAGRHVSLQSMSNKRLAVDTSLWVHQFLQGMKDRDGRLIRNAHIIGVIYRLCKLLFWGVKPVFVFDGSTPALKRKTMEERRRRRSQKEKKILQTAQKLVSARLKLHALKTATNAHNPSAKSSQHHNDVTIDPRLFEIPHDSDQEIDDPDVDDVSKQEKESVVNRIQSRIEGKEKRVTAPQYIEDPDVSERISRLQSTTVSKDSKSAELQKQWEEIIETLAKDEDLDGSRFKQLPPEIQYELLMELKNNQKYDSWRLMKQVDADHVPADVFSSLQVQKMIKSHHLTQSIDMLRSKIHKETIGGVEINRIASDPNTDYIYISRPEPTSMIAPQEVSDDSDGEEKLSLNQEEKEAASKFLSRFVPNDEVLGDYVEKKKESHHGNTNIPPTQTISQPLSDEQLAMILQEEEYLTNGHVNIQEDEPLTSRYQDIPLHHQLEKISKELDNENEFQQSLLHGSIQRLEHQVAKQSSLGNQPPNITKADQSDSTADTRFNLSDFFDENEVHDLEPCYKHSANPEEEEEEEEEKDDFVELVGLVENEEESQVEDKLDYDEDEEDEEDEEEDEEEDVDLDYEILGLKKTELNKEHSQSDEDEWEDSFQPAEQPEMKQGLQQNRHENHQNSDEEHRELDIAKSSTEQPTNHADQIIEESQTIGYLEKTDELGMETNQTNDISSDEDIEESVHEIANLQQEFGDLIEQVKSGNAEQMIKDLESEESLLRRDRQQLGDFTDSIDAEIFRDIQEVLAMFGVPFICGPMEAEAQCAHLEATGFVDGIITDDSDVWLFGGQNVFRHIFDQSKYAELYKAADIQSEVGLNRRDMIDLALLLGSDYTSGVSGIGAVHGLEIVNSFIGDKRLEHFLGLVEGKPRPEGVDERAYCQLVQRMYNKRHTIVVPPGFPSYAVVEAYLNPNVVTPSAPFEWRRPDISSIIEFVSEKLGWTQAKVDEIIVPAVKKYQEREIQPTLESYYGRVQVVGQVTSLRMFQAMQGLKQKATQKKGGATKRSTGQDKSDSEEENRSQKTSRGKGKKPKRAKTG